MLRGNRSRDGTKLGESIGGNQGVAIASLDGCHPGTAPSFVEKTARGGRRGSTKRKRSNTSRLKRWLAIFQLSRRRDVLTQPGANSQRAIARKLLQKTMVLVLLVTWAAVFGARTVRRCDDWATERILFESALEVCPNGIKTLNNLASTMLNADEAERAEGLLLRAIEVRESWVEIARRYQPILWVFSVYAWSYSSRNQRCSKHIKVS